MTAAAAVNGAALLQAEYTTYDGTPLGQFVGGGTVPASLLASGRPRRRRPGRIDPDRRTEQLGHPGRGNRRLRADNGLL